MELATPDKMQALWVLFGVGTLAIAAITYLAWRILKDILDGEDEDNERFLNAVKRIADPKTDPKQAETLAKVWGAK